MGPRVTTYDQEAEEVWNGGAQHYHISVQWLRFMARIYYHVQSWEQKMAELNMLVVSHCLKTSEEEEKPSST